MTTGPSKKDHLTFTDSSLELVPRLIPVMAVLGICWDTGTVPSL